jgi:hypothetical protein
VQDPGFETGPSNFEAQDESSSVAQVSTNPIDGSGSLRVAIAGYGNNVWWTYDAYGIAASHFRVSAHLRSDIDRSSDLMFCAMAYFSDGSADLNCTPVPGAAGDKGQASAAVEEKGQAIFTTCRLRMSLLPSLIVCRKSAPGSPSR